MIKILRVIAAIMFFMMVAFILTGVFSRSYSYDTSILINGVPDEVYSKFTDNDSLKDWMTGLSNVQTIRKTDNEVGSVYKFFVKDPGSQEVMSYTETVTQADPGKEYAIDMNNEWFTGSNRYVFEDQGNNQTLLSASTSVKGKGLFKRAILRLMKSGMIKQGNLTNKSFKAYVEAKDE